MTSIFPRNENRVPIQRCQGRVRLEQRRGRRIDCALAIEAYLIRAYGGAGVQQSVPPVFRLDPGDMRDAVPAGGEGDLPRRPLERTLGRADARGTHDAQPDLPILFPGDQERTLADAGDCGLEGLSAGAHTHRLRERLGRRRLEGHVDLRSAVAIVFPCDNHRAVLGGNVPPSGRLHVMEDARSVGARDRHPLPEHPGRRAGLAEQQQAGKAHQSTAHRSESLNWAKDCER